MNAMNNVIFVFAFHEFIVSNFVTKIAPFAEFFFWFYIVLPVLQTVSNACLLTTIHTTVPFYFSNFSFNVFFLQVEYYIKWEGYSSDENSWEPVENVDPELVWDFEENLIKEGKYKFKHCIFYNSRFNFNSQSSR